jgi:hypothetical protein
MHSAVGPEFRRGRQNRPSDAGLPGIEDDPAVAVTYGIAEAVMDVAGPLFWAVLVLAFVTGPLGIDLPQ